MSSSAEGSLPEGDVTVFVVDEVSEVVGIKEPYSLGNPASLWAGSNPFHAIVGGGVGGGGGPGGVDTRSVFVRHGRALLLVESGDRRIFILCCPRIGVLGRDLRVCSDSHLVERSAPNSCNREILAC